MTQHPIKGRAASAKEYIVRLGVALSRLESVSFGSE